MADPGLDLVQKRKARLDVGSEYRRHEAEIGVIRDGQRLVPIADADYSRDGTEGLFGVNPHARQ